MARLLVLLLRLYQLTLSRVLVALFGPVCRFTPSCSAYAIECVRLHGAVRGSLLSIKRLSKCHPFHPGGYDPPPPRDRESAPTGQLEKPTVDAPRNGGFPAAPAASSPSSSATASTSRSEQARPAPPTDITSQP